MPAFVSLPELKAYLGNFVSNDPSEPEFADGELQKKLNAQAKKIKRTWSSLYPEELLPEMEGTKASPTWLDLLLELLNLDYVVAEVLKVQAIRKFGLSQRQSEIYEKLAAYRFELFELGELSPAILSYLEGRTFDTTPFLQANDRLLSNQTPNLTINEKTKPNLIQTQRFCLRESAFIRAIAANPGFNSTIDDLTDDQLGAYQEILVALVAPQVCRIVLSYEDQPYVQVTEFINKSVLDSNPANIYSAKTLIETLDEGTEYHPVFLL
ncbi:MAG: hypothetical protein FD167_1274 [bacterium]|nr:MAG: hypothetical protein FD167_1274 [bacterium]